MLLQDKDTKQVRKKIKEIKKLQHEGKFIDYENELELSYSKFINKGDIIVDIGCHAGRHLKKFIHLSIGGGIIAFEPLPEQFKYLVDNFTSDGIEIMNVALSDFSGTSDFIQVDGALEESGLRKRYIYNNPTIIEPHTIQVKVQRLDEYYDKLKDVKYIKIDTEGAEMSILRGAEKVIVDNLPIISVEYGEPTYKAYGETKESLWEWAVNHNYMISDLWGNMINNKSLWIEVCDSVYWDYFLVHKSKVSEFKGKLMKRRFM